MSLNFSAKHTPINNYLRGLSIKRPITANMIHSPSYGDIYFATNTPINNCLRDMPISHPLQGMPLNHSVRDTPIHLSVRHTDHSIDGDPKKNRMALNMTVCHHISTGI